jgi:O-antigen/teichoic acid export membrane protein
MVLLVAASFIATRWLNIAPSAANHAASIIRCMALAFFFHWPTTLYQSALMGLGRQVEASVLSGGAAMARLVVGYAMACWVADVEIYFGALAACNLVIVAIARMAYRGVLSRTGISRSASAARDWGMLQYRGYALQLALIMMMGYLLVSVDRMLAAKILPLGQYAEYSIVCSISQGISLATSAVVGASLPRLVQAFTRLDQYAYQETLLVGQLAIGVVCVPVYVAIAFSPEPLLDLVAGHKIGSEDFYRALVIHASGTLAHTLMVLSFAAHQCQKLLLQWLMMAVLLTLGAIVFAVVFKPAWGAIGLSYFWLFVGLMQLVIGIAISFRLRYHEASPVGLGQLLACCLQVTAGVGAGYLTWHAVNGRLSQSISPAAASIQASAAAALASLVVVLCFMLAARKFFAAVRRR